MRLHRLEVSAFGPFRDAQRIDFDALSSAGLFLLHGATGAGKTSVLDAVCFALYGRVPGARAGVGALRSHYAENDEAPEVCLEFSVGPRRFEVVRRPAWERPKRRGTGVTTAQASVRVRELVDGEWQARATRIDEAAHLVEDVLGMGVDQFTKLVLLPQNEFAAFLRADADARRTLLEKLFGTDRFGAVQDWLREQRAVSRVRLTDLESGAGRLLARAEQACAPVLRRPPGTGAEADAGSGPAAGEPDGCPAEDLARRVGRLLTAVGQAREQAWSDQLSALAALERAEIGHDQATAMVELAGAFSALVERQEALDAGTGTLEEARRRLRQADRARALAPLAPAVRAARQRRDEALAAVGAAVEALVAPPAAGPGPGEGPDLDAVLDAVGSADAGSDAGSGAEAMLAAEVDRLRTALALLDGLAAEAAERDRVAAAVAAGRRRASELAGRAQALDRRREQARQEQQQHAASAETAAAVAVTLAAARASAEEAGRRSRAAADRERLAAELAAAEDRLARARQEAASAREHWLDLRERRLDGFAAELAATLQDGDPCRVCGATEHPAPAAAGADPVDAAAERRAGRAAEQASTAVAELASTAARLGGSLQAAAEQAGDVVPAAAEQALRQAEDAVRAAASAAEDRRRHEEAAGVAEAAVRAATAEREHLEQAAAAQTAELAALSARAESLTERVVAVCGPGGDPGARRREVGRRLVLAEAVLAARRDLATAGAELAQVHAAALTAARDGGFADLDEALGAVLGDRDHAALERSVIDYQVEHESVYEQLADERFTALHEGTAAVLDAAGLQALGEEVTQIRFRSQEAAHRLATCDSAMEQLMRLRGEVTAHLQRLIPAQEEFRSLDDLVRCADGTGGDNALRMSLSSFVLAARLEQVSAAASVRLGQMSSGRYALVHTDQRDGGRGRGRAGLSLAVVDAWTGRRRETASLSGGESFYTSLALALGLADVVAEESGGVHLDTLFIDEGFGSLDEDTLEEVMDTLDGLRSGGRAVGVVSHLAELRQRIGTRLDVVKSDRGSTLTTVAS